MAEQCQNPGAFKYTWPGKNEAHICAECVPKLSAVANAIGLYVQIREVPESEQWQCEQVREEVRGEGEE